MTTFHPAFDLITRTWFVDDIEAPTLRALKALLPRRTKFKGYYPKGFNAVRSTSTEQRTYMPIKQSLFVKRAPVQKPIATPQPTIPTAADDAILDDWALGMSGNAIANKHGIINVPYIMKKIRAARNRGDPRAISHQKPFATRPKKYDHDDILNLWSKGVSGPEIGRRLGLHASTTAAQIVSEYRRKGDSRALSRAPARHQ